jgi:2-amino-4-hydroxy-6-hydroxymethyldihydropteridine diphosphokinase
VGSNIDPQKNITGALSLLRRQVTVTASSTFYRSRAEGRPEQGRPQAKSLCHQEFSNGVWRIHTAIEPSPLKFDVLRSIENHLGRRRDVRDKFADRTIDLDLILYAECIIDAPELRIPDPGIVRPFVAVPLLELAPGLILPDGRPLAELPGANDPTGLEPLAELTAMLRAALRRDVRTTE